MIKFKSMVEGSYWEKIVLLALVLIAINITKIKGVEWNDKQSNELIGGQHQALEWPVRSVNRSTVTANKRGQDDLKALKDEILGSGKGDQYPRLSYNISFSTNATSTQGSHNLTLEKDYDLAVSDSRPRTRLSREDDDLTFDTATEDEGPVSYGYSNDVDNPEEAGSSLSERRLIKEVTRELSKIMGKASSNSLSDIEMLDSWRGRQHKSGHDGRAKLISDLFSGIVDNKKTAMNENHPNVRKQIKATDSSNQLTSGPLNSILASYNGNLDPELANDAETVVQHIQSLASAIDGSNNGGLVTGHDNSDQASESPKQSSEPDNRRDIFSSSPIVRQFRKIKTQISHRRKQLDHIKKMFNVELSLNNTSQQNGSSSSKKIRDINDILVVDDLTASRSKKKLGDPDERKLAKVQELMNYLKENPEVLTSVMSELNNEAAEPIINDKIMTPHEESDTDEGFSTSYSGSYSPESERKIGHPRRYVHDNDSQRSNRGSRWKVMRQRESDLDENHYQSSGRAFNDRSSYYKRVRRFKDDPVDSEDYNQKSIYQSNSHSPSHSSSQIVPAPEQNNQLSSATNTTTSTTTTRSPEAEVLESLRDRQLLNLAKLDRFIAEKQASNMTNVYSSSNRSNVKTRLPVEQQQASGSHGINATKEVSDDEIVHHFMVMNGHNAGLAQDRQLPVEISNLDDQGWSHGGRGPSNQNRMTLSRFNSWRDVSQSEASSSQSDQRAHLHPNITRQRQGHKLVSSPRRQNLGREMHIDAGANMHQNSDSIMRSPQAFGNEFNDNEDYGDSFIIKPGQSSSAFMTRSSVTDGESSSESSVRGSLVKRFEDSSGHRNEDKDLENRMARNQPIDYFSAYKKSENNALRPLDTTIGFQRVAKTRFQQDTDGSMWAR